MVHAGLGGFTSVFTARSSPSGALTQCNAGDQQRQNGLTDNVGFVHHTLISNSAKFNAAKVCAYSSVSKLKIILCSSVGGDEAQNTRL